MTISEEGSFELINIRVPAKLKRDLKSFCEKHDYNMSEALLTGVRLLILAEENIASLEEVGRRNLFSVGLRFFGIQKRVYNVVFDMIEAIRNKGKLDSPAIRKDLEAIKLQVEGVTE